MYSGRLPAADDNNFLNFPSIVGKRCNLFDNYSGFRSKRDLFNGVFNGASNRVTMQTRAASDIRT